MLEILLSLLKHCGNMGLLIYFMNMNMNLKFCSTVVLVSAPSPNAQKPGPKIKKMFVWCTPTYPILPPPPNFFWHFWKIKCFFAPFSSENHDVPIVQQCKRKKYAKKNFFLPTYPTKKYRVGVQQTNSCLRMALGMSLYNIRFNQGFEVVNVCCGPRSILMPDAKQRALILPENRNKL